MEKITQRVGRKNVEPQEGMTKQTPVKAPWR